MAGRAVTAAIALQAGVVTEARVAIATPAKEVMVGMVETAPKEVARVVTAAVVPQGAGVPGTEARPNRSATLSSP